MVRKKHIKIRKQWSDMFQIKILWMSSWLIIN